MAPHEHLNMYVIYIYISINNEKFSESLCLYNVPKLWTEIKSLNIFKCLCLQILGVFFQATKVYWKWSNRPVHCANKCMICSHEKLINETSFLNNLFWIWMLSIFCLADGVLIKLTSQKVRHLDSVSLWNATYITSWLIFQFSLKLSFYGCFILMLSHDQSLFFTLSLINIIS